MVGKGTDKRTEANIKLTEAQIEVHFQSSLTTLEQMARIYDDGSPYISFALSNEITKILTDNATFIKYRGAVQFDSPLKSINERNLMASSTLVIMRIDNSTPHVDFIPVYASSKPQTRKLKFGLWWNNETIYVASSSSVGAPAGAIDLDPTKRLAWKNRRKLSRRELVQLVRNKFGAHFDGDIPEILDQLQRAGNLGFNAAVDRGDGKNYATWDGTLPVRVGATAAMIRQITEEVLIAYGRR